MRIGWIFILSLGLIYGICSFGLAGEVMPWVTPTSIGGVNTEVYYAHSTQKVKLNITGYEVPFDYVSQKVNIKCTLRPGLGVEVYVLAGLIGSELKDGSTSYKGKMDDALYGGGIRYVLLGDIIILPAISFSLGLTHSSSNLTKEDGEEIDFTLDTTELQGSVTASKKIGMVTPYAGVKFFRNWIRWKDEEGDKGKGNSGDISPFLGAKISFSPLLSIKGEISFADEVTYAGGLNLSLGL
ncbi:MAG TPA: hypothetical protein VMW39_00100 [bacterium]|nr:hypothetical protein [bacterium]